MSDTIHELRFDAIHEALPGERWARHFAAIEDHLLRWFRSEGEAARPGYVSCRRALSDHMPELVPTWERLCELAGGSDPVARMLSLWRPATYYVACSQAIWLRGEPALVRNYDYHPRHCEGLVLSSAWTGTRVIASADSGWGVLDGMNEHGLVVSLSFGGRRDVGDGFALPLILRYVLEIAEDTASAVAILRRVPSHMAYTVAVLDRTAAASTVHVHAGGGADVTDERASTNHQESVAWQEHADLTRSLERQAFLDERLADPDETLDGFAARFLGDPLYNRAYSRGLGTLYTAVYRPVPGRVELRWPGRSWHQSLTRFEQGTTLVRYSGT